MSPIRPSRRIESATGKVIIDENLEKEKEKDQSRLVVDRLRSSYFWFYNTYNNYQDYSYGSKEIEKWDGGEWKGKQHQPIWGKIIHNLNKHKITNIERFVAAQFLYRSDKRIYPTHLLSSQSIDYYYRLNETADRNLSELLRCNLSLFKVLFDEVRHDKNPTLTVLGNIQNDLSPLFRWIVASREGLSEVVNKIESAAYTQLRKDPEGYLRLWGPYVSRDVLLNLLPDNERIWYV